MRLPPWPKGADLLVSELLDAERTDRTAVPIITPHRRIFRTICDRCTEISDRYILLCDIGRLNSIPWGSDNQRHTKNGRNCSVRSAIHFRVLNTMPITRTPAVPLEFMRWPAAGDSLLHNGRRRADLRDL